MYAHHKQYPGECVSSGRCSGTVQMVSEYYCVVICDSEKDLAQINNNVCVYVYAISLVYAQVLQYVVTSNLFGYHHKYVNKPRLNIIRQLTTADLGINRLYLKMQPSHCLSAGLCC